MNLIECTHELDNLSASIKEELSKFVQEIESRISYYEVYDIHPKIWDEGCYHINTVMNSKLANYDILEDRIIYKFHYEAFDGYDYYFNVIYMNKYNNMSYDEIVDYIIEKSNRLISQDNKREINRLKEKLKYLESLESL